MRYVVTGAIATAIAIGALLATGGSGGALSANIFVGAAGSCTRSVTITTYSATTSCGTFQAAFTAASCGDIIGAEPNTYAEVEIDENTAKGCSSQITIEPDNGTVRFVTNTSDDNPALSLGGSCKCSSHIPPDHLTFNGLSSNQFVTGVPGVMGSGGQMGQVKIYADYETPASNDILANHDEFRHMDFCNGCPDPGGGTIEFTSDQNTVLDHDIFGPVCCGNTHTGAGSTSPTLAVFGHRDEGASTHNTTNLSVTYTQFLGETYCATNSPSINPDCTHADWPTSLGSPPQLDCNDPGGSGTCHADCLHFTGINGLTFEQNILYSCRAQALFFENQNSGTSGSNGGTNYILNNFFDSLGSGCAACFGGTEGQFSTTSGTWVFGFNTCNVGCGFSGPSTFTPGNLSVTFVGNIGSLGNHGDDLNSNGCATDETQIVDTAATSGTFTLTYGGQTTAAINYNDSASTVQGDLTALSSIGSGNMKVAEPAKNGMGQPTGEFSLTFVGSLGNTNVAQVTGNGSGLVGGTLSIATTSQGGGASPFTYIDDVWSNASCSGDQASSALNLVNIGDWSSSPSDNTTNYNLAGTNGTNAADDVVPTATCTSYTTVDVHGNTRPAPGQSACDAGGAER